VSARSATAGGPPATDEHGLRRVIGLWDSVGLVVGLIIGSGIFRAPVAVAQELPTAALMLAAWVLGGVLSLAGGLAAAELGVRYPRTGGQYVFLERAFGPSLAFSYGWTNVLISKPSVLAGIAMVFAGYFAPLLGLPGGAWAMKAYAMAAVVLFTIVNAIGVRSGTSTQNLFTIAKVAGLAAIALVALASGRGDWSHFSSAAAAPLERALPVAMALGLVTILYTYDGWFDLTTVGGEIARPGRVLPRAILLGTLACTTLYLLANVAYLYLVPPAEMTGATNIAAVALERAVGPVGGAAVSVLVMVSTLGILNGSILTGVRIPFAMARDGFLPRPLGEVHATTGSPVNALITQAVFTCLVVAVADSFEQVASLFVSTSWFFYAVCFVGLLRLQARERRTGEPSHDSHDDATFRMPLTPWPAVFFIVIIAGVIASDLILGGLQVLVGLAVIFLGVPAYFVWKRMQGARGV
jgi:amino acid transporter